MSIGHTSGKVPRPAHAEPRVVAARDGIYITAKTVNRKGEWLGDHEIIVLTDYHEMITLAAEILEGAVQHRRNEETNRRVQEELARVRQPSALDD